MMAPVFTIARFSFVEAVRGKIIWLVFALLLLTLSISLFISQMALTETRESEVALMSGFLRLSSVLIIIFFVVASIARDFQDKSIELLFSVNMPRYQVFMGKFLGFSIVALITASIFFFGLVFFANSYSVLLWSISLWCELTLVALVALLFIFSLQNVTLSLIASISVYSLMRFMPAIQSMGDGPFQHSLLNKGINSVVDIIDLILPRLDQFSQSSWLVYGGPELSSVVSFSIEFVLFVGVFTLVAIIDLRRKSI